MQRCVLLKTFFSYSSPGVSKDILDAAGPTVEAECQQLSKTTNSCVILFSLRTYIPESLNMNVTLLQNCD